MTAISATDNPNRRRGRPRGALGKRKPKPPLQRVGLRIDEFAASMGVSRAAVVAAIERGELRETRIGTCRIIPASELDRLISTNAK